MGCYYWVDIDFMLCQFLVDCYGNENSIFIEGYLQSFNKGVK